MLGLPFGLLWLVTFLKYETDKGDLIRIGYISNSFPEYRSKFESELNKEIVFDRLSDEPSKRDYDVLTIGDSFSEQGAAGYQNYLEMLHGKSVLHIDQSFHNNPIQLLISLFNGGFFEEFKVNNVILEGVERHFISNSIHLKLDSSINFKQLKPKFQKKVDNYEFSLISNRIFKFPYYSIYRILFPESLVSDVYVRKLKRKRFSVDSNNLYFYHLDIKNINVNNYSGRVVSLNNVFNIIEKELKNLGVNLIVLPVPDKFHFYRDYLENPQEFEVPLFFNDFSKMTKNYEFVNLLDTEYNKDSNLMDFYYYDDSHWSPLGSKMVAKELSNYIIDKEIDQ